MSDLLPCPFCGAVPDLESAVQGTQYEIWCDCGMASSCIQISDLMTIKERSAPKAWNGVQYADKYIARARREAIKRWNTRKR